MSLFKLDHAAATAALRNTPIEIAGLHDCQMEMVEKVEKAIAAGNCTALVAVATRTAPSRRGGQDQIHVSWFRS
jgi:type I site-specific restriction endonuclease